MFIYDVEVRYFVVRCRGCGWEWLFLYCSIWCVVDGVGNVVGVYFFGFEGGFVFVVVGIFVVFDFYRWFDFWFSFGIYNLIISGEYFNRGIKLN